MNNAVVISNLVKTFGNTRALKGVNVEIPAGQITALVGENGAGKSTALGCVAGRIAPTDGTIHVLDQELKYGDPLACRKAGVVAIYQELTIIPALSAAANVFLAEPLTRAGVLSERAMRERYLELCERVGVQPAPARALARDLSVAEQQVLEILRALVSDAQVILFDEPTASLAQPEREALFRLMRSLKAAGRSLVIVSHNLDEVLDISDYITVFRDGNAVTSGPSSDFTKASLVKAMIGKAGDERVMAEMLKDGASETVDAKLRRRFTSPTPVLAVQNLHVPGILATVDLEIHSGEILGIGGLVGSGRSTLLRTLAGVMPKSGGRMWIDGKEVSWPRSVRQSLDYGIALIPEDRKGQGLILSMSVADNIVLHDYAPVSSFGIISSRRLNQAASDAGAAFGLAGSRVRDRASHLSGGNQQKLLLARWRHSRPRVLLADEPTRGIDVGAKAEILRSLEEMAGEGLGIAICSSELEEVVALAERVVVLAEGRHVATLDSDRDAITPHSILNYAFGIGDNDVEQTA